LEQRNGHTKQCHIQTNDYLRILQAFQYHQSVSIPCLQEHGAKNRLACGPVQILLSHAIHNPLAHAPHDAADQMTA
jgi:hypothetical protein